MNILNLIEQLKRLDHDINTLQKQRQKLVNALEKEAILHLRWHATTAIEHKASSKEIETAVTKLLQAHSSPLTTTVLFEKLSAMGLEIVGKNPKRNLSSAMSRNKKFKSIPDLGWWFVGQAIEDNGSYKPDPPKKPQQTLFTESSITRAMRGLQK